MNHCSRTQCRDVNLQGFHVQLREILAYNGTPSTTSTLVILFGFFRPSDKVISKYCQLYHDHGFNVLFIPSYLKNVVWPRNSVYLSRVLLDYLTADLSNYSHLIIHAISMGGYFCSITMEMMRSEVTKYDRIRQKVRGIVYDRILIGTFRHVGRAVAMGVSKNAIIQGFVVLITYLYFIILAMLDWASAKAYRKSRRGFKLYQLDVPTLWFHGKNDPLSDYSMVPSIVDQWRAHLSTKLVTKFWPESKHAAHLQIHAEEYLGMLRQFLLDLPDMSKMKCKNNRSDIM